MWYRFRIGVVVISRVPELAAIPSGCDLTTLKSKSRRCFGIFGHTLLISGEHVAATIGESVLLAAAAGGVWARHGD